MEAREMAQRLQALVNLPEDQASFPKGFLSLDHSQAQWKEHVIIGQYLGKGKGCRRSSDAVK